MQALGLIDGHGLSSRLAMAQAVVGEQDRLGQVLVGRREALVGGMRVGEHRRSSDHDRLFRGSSGLDHLRSRGESSKGSHQMTGLVQGVPSQVKKKDQNASGNVAVVYNQPCISACWSP